MKLIPLFLGMVTFVSTLSGGLLAARYSGNLGRLAAFSAGVLIAVPLFDLLPETFNLATQVHVPLEQVMYVTALGFIFLYILERYVSVHRVCEDGVCRNERHPKGGLLGGGELSAHSFMDGFHRCRLSGWFPCWTHCHGRCHLPWLCRRHQYSNRHVEFSQLVEILRANASSRRHNAAPGHSFYAVHYHPRAVPRFHPALLRRRIPLPGCQRPFTRGSREQSTRCLYGVKFGRLSTDLCCNQVPEPLKAGCVANDWLP
jgi:hypothetical protein